MRCSQHRGPPCLLLQSRASTQPPGARGRWDAGTAGGSRGRAGGEPQQPAGQHRDSPGCAVPTPRCQTRAGRSAGERVASRRWASCARIPQVQTCPAPPSIPAPPGRTPKLSLGGERGSPGVFAPAFPKHAGV